MAPDQPASTRPFVLLTEDDADIRGVFEIVLAERYEIALAETGEQALALARRRRPDVVMLDWTLPDASGDSVVERLRDIGPEFRELPIVIVSGAQGLGAIAARVGAIPCPKPCTFEQLIGAIERALEAARRAGS
jgi:DNA-binding NtrC family response regulator